MKKSLCRLIAICIAVCILLSGCVSFTFSDMEYSRPDMDGYRRSLQRVYDALDAETDVQTLMDRIWEFYGEYYDFYTSYALANIYYCKDLTDIYWEKEYTYCLEAGTEVDATLDQLLYDLAACPLKEELEREGYFGPDFFADYLGESIWTEEFTVLMEQEAALESQYYALAGEISEVPYYSEEFFAGTGSQMAALYAELVALRQEIAACAGYEDYPSFAYDCYYYRDYTPTQALAYMEQIRQELVPLYRQMSQSDVWQLGTLTTTEQETFSYVQHCAGKMGDTVAEAFDYLEEGQLYDISYGKNKYDASFEIYLMNYNAPYIFMNPSMTLYDPLTFAHEFGHFCNDYASRGSQAGVDVAEVFSQGMEYLSLFYGEDTADLEKLKMADSLCVYVEQAAYASFEQQVYSLEEDALTAEGIQELFDQTGSDFGLDVWSWDSRSFVLIPHFFTNPMYIISYVVSNDAALQLYQLEQAEPGTGLLRLQENLTTEETYFLAFLDAAGLESPFAQGRVQSVRKTFEDVLQ